MPGPFDFLHIKGHTAGSSNELSFDVLDAARTGIDPQKRRSDRSPAGPKPSQGTYQGVAGTSTLSNVPEVERRKRARRARTARNWALAVVAVAALAVAGFFAVRGALENQASFDGRFGSLISGFVEVDQTLAQIDELMVDPLGPDGLDDRDAMLDVIPGLERSLNAVAAEASELEQSAPGDDDRAALGEVQAAAIARGNMLDAADGAFTLSAVVNKQVADANEAWNQVLAGDAAAREATELANAASTEEATLQAREKTQEAIADLTSAREGLARLEKEAAGLDCAAELAYIDKRLEALEVAVETSDALLANDRSAAKSANDAYNRADSAAADLAAALASTPAEKVVSLHDGDVQRAQQAYETARAEATAADSALRAYLPA